MRNDRLMARVYLPELQIKVLTPAKALKARQDIYIRYRTHPEELDQTQGIGTSVREETAARLRMWLIAITMANAIA